MALPLTATALSPSLPAQVSLSENAFNSKKQLLKQERKAAKLAARAALPVHVVVEPIMFLPREWRYLETQASERKSRKVSIMTWNMLAQALVRRELFPGSDFLKVKDRIPTLTKEILHVDADIICLQELDRLEDHLPSLTIEYSYTYHIGYPDKPHGLLIGYKTALLDKVGERTGKLDELPIFDSDSSLDSSPVVDKDASPTPRTRQSLGLSRSTRNVFLLVALKYKGREGGIIVGTTHLFWHPTATYERARQTGILFREAKKFRDFENGGQWRDWDVVLAGDFNTQPNEITYSLVLSDTISASQEQLLAHSTLVHQSVDKKYDPTFVSIALPVPEAREGEDEEGVALSTDPDKVIRNARQAKEEDGMIDLDEFKRLFDWHPPPSSSAPTSLPDLQSAEKVAESRTVSAYGSIAHWFPSLEDQTYVDRTPEVHSTSGWVIPEDLVEKARRKEGGLSDRVRRGDFEPKWTNFTPLWRCTLDYIFLLPRSPLASPARTSQPPSRFTGLLDLHPSVAMGDGLPKKGVGASDHVSLAAELEVFL